MESKTSREIELRVPYFQSRQVILTQRYHWNCWDRGKVPFVLVQWTQSGTGVFENAGGRHLVPADHAFVAVVPEPSTYYYPPEARAPWTVSWLNVYGSLGCELFRKLQAEFGPVIPLASRGAAAASFRRLLTEGGPRESAPDRLPTSLQVYSFVLEWWSEASQPPASPEDRVARALRFAREHFREPLGIKELAGKAGMSREHFSRVFTERMGETPSAALRRLRVREAEALLRETDLPLREIAMRSGFYSERHLMRTFQRTQGWNPSRYRRRKS